jgi:4'-phosphopantetheinyl transferase
MAICFYKEIGEGKLALWEITEETNKLLELANLQGKELEEFQLIKNPRRQHEWLATRILMGEMLGCKAFISYNPDGRPYLENHAQNISISHTGKYVAILIHPKYLTGIDIEEQNRPVEKVAKRFLSPEEMESCINHLSSNKAMLLHWCAKETIFKMVPVSNIDFATQISISLNEINENGSAFTGSFLGNDLRIPVGLSYFFVGPVIMVWGWLEADYIFD